MLDDLVKPEAAATVAGGVRICLFASLRDCEGPWRDAAARWPGYLFQQFEWLMAYQATIGAAENVSPCIVQVADRAGTPVMLLALGIYRHYGLRVLRPLGVPVTDYNAPLVDPGFAAGLTPARIEQLWGEIRKILPRVDLIWLRRMPEAIDGIPNPLIRLPGAVAAESANAALLPPTMEGYRHSHGVNWKANQRRRRRLAELGRVEFDVPDKEACKLRVFTELAPLKSAHWLRTGAGDWFAKPANLGFYRGLTMTGLGAGEISVSRLAVAERAVAAQWGVVFRGRFYLLITAYDEAWSRYGVGSLAIEQLIERCIADPGVAIFDFTAGDEAYKRDWTDRSMTLYELVAPVSTAGAAYLVVQRVRRRLKRQRWLRNLVRRLKGRKPL